MGAGVETVARPQRGGESSTYKLIPGEKADSHGEKREGSSRRGGTGRHRAYSGRASSHP